VEIQLGSLMNVLLAVAELVLGYTELSINVGFRKVGVLCRCQVSDDCMCACLTDLDRIHAIVSRPEWGFTLHCRPL
jgi:hypothetical protein